MSAHDSAEKDVPPGFVPTTTSPHWRGKYRCAYCAVTGWVNGWTNYPKWWGHRHGENCPKRTVTASAKGDGA